MEHIEKIETAFVSVLQALTWPAGFDTDLILPGETDEIKSGQCVICFIDDADQEDPPNTGNKWHTIRIELRTPVHKKTSQVDMLAKHQAAAAVLETGLLADDLKDLLMAAVDDFTCFGILDRLGIRDRTTSYWMSGMTLRVHSAPSDLS